MANIRNDFSYEYEYNPSPDAEEQLAEVWDILFALILKDIQNEKQGETIAESASC
jgi:hypothetical protein